MAFFDATWFTGLETALTSLGTALVGAAGAFFALRRKYSSYTSEIVRDKTENRLLITLQTERDAAVRLQHEAMEHRLRDVTQVATLTAKLEATEDKAKELREELIVLRLRLQRLMAVVVKLDPKALEILQQADDDP